MRLPKIDLWSVLQSWGLGLLSTPHFSTKDWSQFSKLPHHGSILLFLFNTLQIAEGIRKSSQISAGMSWPARYIPRIQLVFDTWSYIVRSSFKHFNKQTYISCRARSPGCRKAPCSSHVAARWERRQFCILRISWLSPESPEALLYFIY